MRKNIPLKDNYHIRHENIHYTGLVHKCRHNEWWVIEGSMDCPGCNKLTPKDIQVMYKLWRLNNI